MQAFVRMYEPHEARENTVIFPAFRRVVPAAELAGLGQHFADLERQQFGRDQFGVMVARVARIEQNLGIYDLNQFTPQVGRSCRPVDRRTGGGTSGPRQSRNGHRPVCRGHKPDSWTVSATRVKPA